MLTLVRPPSGGQGGDPPRRRHRGKSPAFSLTHDERQRLAAALRGLRARMGTWQRVAAAMGVAARSIAGVACGMHRGTAAMVLLTARVGGTTVERILSGELIAADKCPHCGRGAS